MNKKLLLLTIISLFLISSIGVYAAEDSILDSVFGALAGDSFDMTEFYGKYSNFVDFLLYLILFIGIAQMTLGKRFEGRGGKSVQIVVGIMLAVGLSVWAAAQDPKFTLAALGPLAGAILMILIILTLFTIIKALLPETAFGKTESFVFAVVLSWWMAQAVAPGVITWFYGLTMVGGMIKATMAILSVVALILLVMKVIVPAFGSIGKSDVERNEVKEESLAKREEKFVSSGLQDISKDAIRETGQLKSILERVKDVLNTIQRPEQREKIVSTIQNELIPGFAKINTLTTRLAGIDSKIMQMIKREAMDNEASKKSLIAKFGDEHKVLNELNAVQKRIKQSFNQTKEIQGILKKIQEIDFHYKDSLQRAVSYVNLGDKEHSNLYIDAAITALNDIEKVFNKMDKEAAKLDAIVVDEIKRLKKARAGTKKAAKKAPPGTPPRASP